jgi:putative phosphoesterase
MPDRGRGTRILVVADTHIPDFARELPPVVLRAAAGVDLIVHAGDVTAPGVLEQLADLAPVRAVRGNNDGRAIAAWGAPESLSFDVDGVRFAVIHDAGPARRRGARMHRRFPDAAVVLFGHSHIPMDVEEDGVRLVNPGSPTWKRRQERPTYVIVTIDRGIRVRIVPF